MRRSLHVAALTLALLAGLLAPAMSGSSATAVTASAGSRPRVGHYNPPSGVMFNNPLAAPEKKWAIFNHFRKSINSSPRGSKIRIASWNVKSPKLTDALVAAHRRGVSVRLTMSRGNANADNPNPSFNRLHRVLATRNKYRAADMTSWARRCRSSCRGTSGISHTKLYLFSRVGKARNVIMFGSANLTDAAADFQWNDTFTLKEHPRLWARFEAVFNQMGRDRPVRDAFQTFGPSKLRAMVYPYSGPRRPSGDIMLNQLQKIRCTGATGGAGINGKTAIRIAQTGWTDERGMALAQRIRTMWNNGCNIRVVYAMMGNRIYHLLRDPRGRGAIPLGHIVQDWNLDGIYDRYLHMKVMTVSGVYGRNHAANFTWNGSSNWTSVSLASDEELMRVVGPRIRRRYADWIDWLYFHPPPRPELNGTTAEENLTEERLLAARRTTKVNPYANMELD